MLHPTRLLFLTATFFCGLAFAFMFPLVSLYLVDEIGTSPLVMGLFLTSMVLSSIVVSAYIGKKSDQGWRRKRIILVAQVSYALAMLVFIFTRDLAFAFAAAIVLLSVSGATLPQIFTMGRLYADRDIKTGGSLFMSLMRAGIAVAWVVGPPMAFLAKEHFGFNVAFSLSLISALLMVAIVMLLPEVQATEHAEDSATVIKGWYRNRPMVLFLLSTALMFSAINMYINSIPLYLAKELAVGSHWAGYFMGLAAFFEIPFMVLAGLLGPKLGNKRLMVVGLGFGTAFFIGLLLADSVAQLLFLQLFNGVYVAIIACLGMLLAQDLMKREMGMATTLFNGAQQVSMLIGNLTVGLVAQFLSYYAIFYVCVAVTLVALLLLLLVKEEPPLRQTATPECAPAG